jgi:hypothetical protein
MLEDSDSTDIVCGRVPSSMSLVMMHRDLSRLLKCASRDVNSISCPEITACLVEMESRSLSPSEMRRMMLQNTRAISVVCY